MIEMKHIFKSFDGGVTFAVDDLSLTIQTAETFVLVGSSGCGKTTTLKMINRLVEPSRGVIKLAGMPIEKHEVLGLRRSIGYVFQKVGLFPHLSVEQNVAIVPRILGWTRARRRRRAHEMLSLVGLDPDQFAARLPSQLSGGQQQRVGVARALAADPQYLLMDEPFGALDPVTRESLQQEMLRLKEQLRKTIVFVTHDVLEATLLADRLGVMHEGRLEQVGTPAELLKSPRTPFVRQVLSRAAQASSVVVECES